MPSTPPTTPPAPAGEPDHDVDRDVPEAHDARTPQSRAEAEHVIATTAEFVIAMAENPALVRRILDEHRLAADPCAFGAPVREACIVRATARGAQRYAKAVALLRCLDDDAEPDDVAVPGPRQP